MKREKLFIGILILAVWLAGCTHEISEEPPSKTTTVDEIVLRALNYTTGNWTGGWETSWQDKALLLSNLLPNGQIKNNTQYEVTITATLEFLAGDDKMEAFQFVFTKPGIVTFDRWTDLAAPSEPTEVTGGAFFVKGTLTTKPDATENYQGSVLALTNAVDVSETDNGEDVAKFTNVEITITEK